MARPSDSGKGKYGSRRFFSYALGISTVFHALVLFSLLASPWGEEEQEPALQVKLEISSTPYKFIKRAPPNQRPLTRPQLPQPLQRPLARKVSPRPMPRMAMSPVHLFGEAPRAGMPGVGGGTGRGNLFSAGKGSGGLLGMGIGPGGGVPSRHIGPKFQAWAVEGSRTGEGEIDLGIEMLDVKALDTGEHRALVVVDPKDKKKIKGFLYLSSVHSERIERAELEGLPRHFVAGTTSSSQPVTRQVAERQTLQGLADKLTEFTQVHAEVLDNLALDDPRLAQVPFLLFTVTCPFEFTEAEATNLGRYLLSGGFLYAEVVAYNPRTSADLDIPALRNFIRTAFRQVGYGEGKDWKFVRLEQNHPLYHCFYDLKELPRGFREMFYFNFSTEQKPEPTPPYLEGIMVGERMAGLYSQKNYADFWSGEAERVRERDQVDRLANGSFAIGGEETRTYEVGINILVYALTQEGSLAQRLVSVE